MKLKKDVKERLSNLIVEFGVHKTKLDKLKKQCDTENSDIKKIMGEYELDEFESGDYVAKYTIQHRESMNEEGLLEFARKHFKDVIRTKEYVDMEALEKKIYNGEVPKKVLLQMDKFREVKEVPTLKLSKKKKED